jgi:hypothetical protein
MELRLQSRQNEEELEVRRSQRALSLMAVPISVERVVVERPSLAPCFQSGLELPSNRPLRDEVLACAQLFSDLAEMCWEADSGWPDERSRRSCMATILRGSEETDPAVTHVLERQGHLFVIETDRVIGRSGARSDALERLGVLD